MLYMESVNINVVDVPQYIPDFLSIKYSKIPNAGLGLFANSDIPQGTFLGNYMGEVYHNKAACPMNDYIFSTNSFMIDGLDVTKTNFARFMNCCYNNDVENVLAIKYVNPGKSCVFTKSNGEKVDINNYVFFYAKRNILKGEELLYDYGEEYRQKLNINF
jgi:SET domain-containing protein